LLLSLMTLAFASGLHTNLSKCSAHLIRCSVDVVILVEQELGCQVLHFPLRYLGLPLGLREPTAAQLQSLKDSVDGEPPCSIELGDWR
jgi:hypothetical protein